MARTPKLIWLLLAGLLGAACSQAPPSPVTPAPARPDDSLLLITDPCAVRLGDIADALLMYYSRTRQLPAKLEELLQVSGAKTTLDFNCPVSGQSYVYVPTNLTGPGTDRRLLVYDATPAHNAKGVKRRGIVAAPARPAHPVNMWVVALDEAMLHFLLQPVPVPAR